MARVIPWKPRRRRLTRFEAAIVGAASATVVLILQPGLAHFLSSSSVSDATDSVALEPEADLAGPARIIDGDTLEIAGERVRLHGIDAFERDQACGGRACGELSRRALVEMTAGQTVSCRRLDMDRYGRTVARCQAAGRDLGAAMVRAGHALAYERYSREYLDEERAARSARAGAWAQGGFIDPADHRAP